MNGRAHKDEFDVAVDDLREYLRDDPDGSRAHRMVEAMMARYKTLSSQAAGQGAGAAAKLASDAADAMLAGTNIVERLSPQLRR